MGRAMVLSALPFVCPRVPWSSSLDPTIANTEEIYTWYMDIHGNMLVMGNITNYGIPSRQKLDDIPSSSGMVTHFYQDLYIYIHSARILTVGWPQSTTCWPWLPTKQKGFNHRKTEILQASVLINPVTRCCLNSFVNPKRSVDFVQVNDWIYSRYSWWGEH